MLGLLFASTDPRHTEYSPWTDIGQERLAVSKAQPFFRINRNLRFTASFNRTGRPACGLPEPGAALNGSSLPASVGFPRSNDHIWLTIDRIWPGHATKPRDLPTG